MSLYNQMMGYNPASGTLLEMLGLCVGAVPRFRDTYIADEGKVIGIYTRTGGGNREAYQDRIDALKEHERFEREYDDERDSTFMSFEFRTPEDRLESTAKILRDENYAQWVDHPTKRYWALIDKLKSGNKDDPEVKHAMEVGKKIMKPFMDGLKGGGPTIIEV